MMGDYAAHVICCCEWTEVSSRSAPVSWGKQWLRSILVFNDMFFITPVNSLSEEHGSAVKCVLDTHSQRI